MQCTTAIPSLLATTLFSESRVEALLEADDGLSQEQYGLLQQWEQLELKNGLLHQRYEND